MLIHGRRKVLHSLGLTRSIQYSSENNTKAWLWRRIRGLLLLLPLVFPLFQLEQSSLARNPPEDDDTSFHQRLINLEPIMEYLEGIRLKRNCYVWSSLSTDPVQGLERLERLSFTPEGYIFWTRQGHKIHYVEQGEGIPVVLIHGFGASTFHWRFVFSCLLSILFSYVVYHILVSGPDK